MASIRAIKGYPMSIYLTLILLISVLIASDAKAIPPSASTAISDQYPWPRASTLPADIELVQRDTLQHSTNNTLALPTEELSKRGGCFSAPEDDQCSGETPSVQFLVDKIRGYGNVGTQISVFYVGWPNGQSAIQKCKAYFGCKSHLTAPHPGAVLWDTVVDQTWLFDQAAAIIKAYGDAHPGHDLHPLTIVDPFMKRLSQAFAEASAYDAYLCTPQTRDADNNFNKTTAWGGWEYPALTRNAAITRVLRVDPDTSQEPQVIWLQGNPATPNEPGG